MKLFIVLGIMVGFLIVGVSDVMGGASGKSIEMGKLQKISVRGVDNVAVHIHMRQGRSNIMGIHLQARNGDGEARCVRLPQQTPKQYSTSGNDVTVVIPDSATWNLASVSVEACHGVACLSKK